MKLLKNKISPGGLYNFSLKIIKQYHPSLLTSFFNTFLELPYFPKSWKHDRFVMIPKLNKPSNSIATLLLALSKSNSLWNECNEYFNVQYFVCSGCQFSQKIHIKLQRPKHLYENQNFIQFYSILVEKLIQTLTNFYLF